MMRRFYEHLSGGETVGTALRNAKLDAIHRFGSHAIPYLWAGYVVDGLADQQIKSSEHKLYASK
jgi:CHAT domain-containing protein